MRRERPAVAGGARALRAPGAALRLDASASSRRSSDGGSRCGRRCELVLIAIGSYGVEREAARRRPRPARARRPPAASTRCSASSERQERERADRQRRRAGARASRYPDLAPRGQEEIVAAVEHAARHGEHLLIEAPTGIGKTVGRALPGDAHALAHDRRVFVLTAKNAAAADGAQRPPPARRPAAPSTPCSCAPRAKMCANGEVICHEEYCPFARDYYAKAPQLRRRAAPARRLGGAAARRVFATATRGGGLPLRDQPRARAAQRSRGLRLQLRLRPLGGALRLRRRRQPRRHHPGDRRDPQSGRPRPRLPVPGARGGRRPRRRRGARARRRRAAAPARRALRRPRRPHRPHRRELARPRRVAAKRPGGHAVEAQLPEDDLWTLRPDFDAAFVDYLEHQRENRSFRAEDPFVGLYFKLLRFLAGLLERGPAFAHLVERRDGSGVLRVLCKDPSRHPRRGAAPGARGDRPVGHALAARVLPRPARLRPRALGDPVAAQPVPGREPAGGARLLDLHHLSRSRGPDPPPLAERLASFADAVDGNCLALFPSFQFLAGRGGAPAPGAQARPAAAARRRRPAARGAARRPAHRPARRRPAAGGGRRGLRRGGRLPRRHAARGGGRRPLPAGADDRDPAAPGLLRGALRARLRVRLRRPRDDPRGPGRRPPDPLPRRPRGDRPLRPPLPRSAPTATGSPPTGSPRTAPPPWSATRRRAAAEFFAGDRATARRPSSRPPAAARRARTKP